MSEKPNEQYEEIGGDECGEMLPGDENLPLAIGAHDPTSPEEIEKALRGDDA